MILAPTLTSLSARKLGGGTPLPPVNLTPPTITAPREPIIVGDELTVGGDTWTNSPTSKSYQWLKDSITQVALGTSYVTTSDDLGHFFVVSEVASNAAGDSSPVGSSPTSYVSSAPVFVENPTIISNADLDNPVVGDTLTVNSDGVFNAFPGAIKTYQWFRYDTTEIVGATSNSYSPDSGDIGWAIYCRIRATNDIGFTDAYTNVSGFVSS